MNKQEAETVIKILSEAHGGGCVFCAKELFKLFLKEFPEHSNTVKKRYKEMMEEWNKYNKECEQKGSYL